MVIHWYQPLFSTPPPSLSQPLSTQFCSKSCVLVRLIGCCYFFNLETLNQLIDIYMYVQRYVVFPAMHQNLKFIKTVNFKILVKSNGVEYNINPIFLIICNNFKVQKKERKIKAMKTTLQLRILHCNIIFIRIILTIFTNKPGY